MKNKQTTEMHTKTQTLFQKQTNRKQQKTLSGLFIDICVDETLFCFWCICCRDRVQSEMKEHYLDVF